MFVYPQCSVCSFGKLNGASNPECPDKHLFNVRSMHFISLTICFVFCCVVLFLYADQFFINFTKIAFVRITQCWNLGITKPEACFYHFADLSDLTEESKRHLHAV
jgi:hypothetical protein